MTTAREIAELRQEVIRLKQQVQQRPIIVPTRNGGPPPERLLSILGGNLTSIGVDGIRYAPSVTAAAVYDPNVDTVYPNGLGYGQLFIDGVVQNSNVLIRHNFLGYIGPVLRRFLLPVLGAETLSFTTSGGSPVTTLMTVYTFKSHI